MLDLQSQKGALIAKTIEDFMTLDLTGVGLIDKIYTALQTQQPGPACMGGAEILVKNVREHGGPVVIATGFPEGAGVPETDGPVGAALLARALFLGLGIESVILVDEDWEEMMAGTCRGAGLSPLPFPEDGVVRPIEFIRPVYIRTVPKDDDGCRKITGALLNDTKPSVVVSIERPGMNDHGLYNGLGGRPLDGLVADLDQFFTAAKAQDIPFIAIGDGGNEMGMGVIAEDLRTFSPKAKDSGIPGRGGVAAVMVADHLIVSNVSNWGATGLVAALSALLEKPNVFHSAELEVRCIEQCVTFGGVDGMFMAPEPAVDGISAKEWAGLIDSLRNTLDRLNGRVTGWKGDSGDWRQQK
ncbi:glutamate cyclase domain-containing protein [Leisingera sp. S232]|uniref:glutamate cyclase domain-containing protein n=1 Tax=Leisingera sp. S232 TaxID=3415132 RepID=UPI003C7A175F